jgi:hypothetical protein
MVERVSCSVFLVKAADAQSIPNAVEEMALEMGRGKIALNCKAISLAN